MVMEKKRKTKKEKKKKSVGIKKADHAIRKIKKKKNVEVENVDVLSTLTESDLVTEKKRETKKIKSVGIKKADSSKRKSKRKTNVKIVENVDVLSTLTNQNLKEISERLNEQNDHSIKKSKRKKNVKIVENIDVLSTLTNQDDKEISEGLHENNGGLKKARKEERDRRSSKKNKKSLGEEASKNKVSHGSSENDGDLKRKKQLKEAKKKRQKDQKSSNEAKSVENEVAVSEDDVYLISSEDDNCSKGMKKWISEYHESRPDIQILQLRIDEFITDHEQKLEKERKEREEQIAEEGWTVVTHHKGRKKTTDTETGTTVGSVSQLVLEDKLAQKKSKLVGKDFYRFQKKEAHRNDIMTLQNKFKEDMKRLQQLRAARKFKPY